MSSLLTFMYALGAFTHLPPQSCAQEINASGQAIRLSDLPDEIVGDLQKTNHNALADSDATLLQTDAPGPNEKGHVQAKFYRGYKVSDQWFVQMQVALFADVRTVVYRYSKGDGKFYREPWKYYSGPSCESIKASLNGVMTPGS